MITTDCTSGWCISFNPAIPLLEMYAKETVMDIHPDLALRNSNTVLFTIEKLKTRGIC